MPFLYTIWVFFPYKKITGKDLLFLVFIFTQIPQSFLHFPATALKHQPNSTIWRQHHLLLWQGNWLDNLIWSSNVRSCMVRFSTSACRKRHKFSSSMKKYWIVCLSFLSFHPFLDSRYGYHSILIRCHWRDIRGCKSSNSSIPHGHLQIMKKVNGNILAADTCKKTYFPVYASQESNIQICIPVVQRRHLQPPLALKHLIP